MKLTLLKSKVHRLKVTEADLHYDGSFTLDRDLMDAAEMYPHERIEVLNVTNGSRLATYVIPGERGSGVACANGAAAHHISKDDIVILVCYAEMTAEEAGRHEPSIVLIEEGNKPRLKATTT